MGLVVAEGGRQLGAHGLRLFCMKTQALIDDASLVSGLFGAGECLLRVRMQLTEWERRRAVFLVVEKGAPLTTNRGSFHLATELKLLLFLQLHRKHDVFR